MSYHFIRITKSLKEDLGRGEVVFLDRFSWIVLQ